MTPESKTWFMRHEHLKFKMYGLLREWRKNGREGKLRHGRIYRTLADELEKELSDCAMYEPQITYKEID